MNSSSPRGLVAALLVAPLLAGIALPAAAQDADDWTGFYAGVHGGQLKDPSDGDTIEFDTNLDGAFGDTVFTAGGANAFSPGFCDGVAQGPTPPSGCADNTGGGDWGLRAGYDWQVGGFAWGLVGEWSGNDYRDAVTAFSTTPARYTMLRKIDDMWAIRARAGFAFGDGANLAYVTGGYARADVANYFFTSNGVNTFTNNGDGSANGYQAGVGVERRFGEHFTMGLEYLATRLKDEDARVRAQGPAPATNAFILANAGGTDFRRSDDKIDLDSLRLTATWRFGGRKQAMVAVVETPVQQTTCADLDDDADGVNNCNDKCSGSPAGMAVGADGCPVPAMAPEPELPPQTYRG